MLRIRLRRTGAKKQPRYRVVVAESRAPRDGAYVEVLGWYNPQADPSQVVVDTAKASEWIARGAQPSERVADLLKRASATSISQPVEAAPKRSRRSQGAADEAAAVADAAAEAPVTRKRGARTSAAEAEPQPESASTDTDGDSPIKTTSRGRATSKKAAAEPASGDAPESEQSA